jgi:hypothetical protein
VKIPLSTHFRKATCAEVDCPQYTNGWKIRVEQLPPELLHAARTSGRRYRELHVSEDETYLIFEAGQACFQESTHRKRLDREEIFLRRDGDSRGNPTGNRVIHTSPGAWADDFGEHQNKLSDAAERG